MTERLVLAGLESEHPSATTVRTMVMADVSVLAELHQRVFVGYAGAAAGPRYLRSFFGWFLSYPSAINLCCGPVGNPWGYVFGAPFGYSKRVNRDLFGELCRAALSHPRVFLRPGVGMQVRNRVRALLLGKENRKAEQVFGPDTFNLVGIGTDPSWRGHGIAGLLLSRFSRIAFEKGFNRLTLDVYKKNDIARHLYSSRGWEPVIDHGEILTLVLRQSGGTPCI